MDRFDNVHSNDTSGPTVPRRAYTTHINHLELITIERHLHVGYDVQNDERAAGVPGACFYHAGVERGSTHEEEEYATLYPRAK